MIKIPAGKYCFLAGVIVFAVLIASTLVYVMMPRGKPVALDPIEIEALSEIVQDGDIICRLGDRFWSQLFKDISEMDKRYSHMGIIRISNEQITVVHSEGDSGHGRDFVNEMALEDFIKIARAIGIYRTKEVDGSQISNLAIEYTGVPFDWHFDMYDDSKLYCTELLYVILKRIAPELEMNIIYSKELDRDIIPLEAISNSDYFSEIYHISTK